MPALVSMDCTSQTSLQSHAETLLARVEKETHRLSDDLLWSIHDAITRTACLLLQSHNDRLPLFKLPDDVLNQIFEALVDPCQVVGGPHFWRTTIVDNTSLIPISHTCRRLREVALSLPLLWRDLTHHRRSVDPYYLARSSDVPLRMFVPPADDIQTVFRELYPRMASRAQELHITSAKFEDMEHLSKILSSRHPILESMSLGAHSHSGWKTSTHTVPLSNVHSPRLRYLSLSTVPFTSESPLPTLTHLCLYDVANRDLHTNVLALLAGCTQLQHFAFGGQNIAFLPPHLLPPAAPPILHTPHLRTITLMHLTQPIIEFYLSLLLHPDTPDVTVQILTPSRLDHAFSSSFLLSPSTTTAPPTHMQIALHPDRRGEWSGYESALSLTTTANGTHTRRAGTYTGPLRLRGVPPGACFAQTLDLRVPGPARVQQAQTQARERERSHAVDDVREVWFVNVARDAPWPAPRRASSDPTALIPRGAKTVVLVTDRGLPFLRDEPPSVRVLPRLEVDGQGDGGVNGNRARDGARARPESMHAFRLRWPRLKTLRIAHGHPSALRLHPSAPTSVPTPNPSNPVPNPDSGYHIDLDLQPLLTELASGAYTYFDTLILQTTPRVRVRTEDLTALRAHFASVLHERVAALPEMPGAPGGGGEGDDPARWGCGAWPGALW